MCIEGSRAHEILSYVSVEPGVARGGGGSTLLGPPVSTTRLLPESVHLSLAKTQSLRWTVADREARLDGKCPSYSLYWALCALRSGPVRTSFLRTWRYDSSSPCSAAARSGLGSDNSIASSGRGSRSGGCGGARRSMSFSRRTSFAGTGRASVPSGTGSRDAVHPVERPSTARLQSSFAPWPSPIPSGARRASMVSSSSSVSTFHNAPLVGSCLVARNDPRRPGEPSSRTTSPISSLRLLLGAHGDLSRALCVRGPASSPPQGRAFQRDRLPYCCVDGAADHRSFSRRLSAALPPPRSRQCLRRRVSTTGEEHRHRRGSRHAALAVAEPLRRARDRHHPTRTP